MATTLVNAAPSAKPIGQPAPPAAAPRRTPKSIPPPPEIPPAPPATMAPTPPALDLPNLMPPLGPTARRGWRAAPPGGAAEAEYWRQRQAMDLAAAEFRRRDQENRQRAELETSIGASLAASGGLINDGECWLTEAGDEIRCSRPDLQAAIKGQEATLIALHKAITKAGEADATGLLQIREGRLRLLYRR